MIAGNVYRLLQGQRRRDLEGGRARGAHGVHREPQVPLRAPEGRVDLDEVVAPVLRRRPSGRCSHEPSIFRWRRSSTVLSMALLRSARSGCPRHPPPAPRTTISRASSIDVTVNADGSFDYRESRTYEFDDDFTFAYYQVEKQRLSGGAPVDITDFVVSENGTPLELGPGRRSTSRGPPARTGSRTTTTATPSTASGSTAPTTRRRTFDISYTVHDAVTVHDDFAQLYWKFIAENWEKPTGRRERLHPPAAGRRPGQGARWLHAPLTSEYWIRDAQTIEFTVDTLPPGSSSR